MKLSKEIKKTFTWQSARIYGLSLLFICAGLILASLAHGFGVIDMAEFPPRIIWLLFAFWGLFMIMCSNSEILQHIEDQKASRVWPGLTKEAERERLKLVFSKLSKVELKKK